MENFTVIMKWRRWQCEVELKRISRILNFYRWTQKSEMEKEVKIEWMNGRKEHLFFHEENENDIREIKGLKAVRWRWGLEMWELLFFSIHYTNSLSQSHFTKTNNEISFSFFLFYSLVSSFFLFYSFLDCTKMKFCPN